jgi:hypothetical protein
LQLGVPAYPTIYITFCVTQVLMNSTVFLTVLSGVITYVIGQLVLKLMLDPVHEMKKTIGQISHSLIEHANIIGNPGVPSQEAIRETSQHLRKISSQLHAHLYLVPLYGFTARLFHLPSRAKVQSASKSLMFLSNNVFRATEKIYEHNTKHVENVCDSLSIYLTENERWPKELN